MSENTQAHTGEPGGMVIRVSDAMASGAWIHTSQTKRGLLSL